MNNLPRILSKVFREVWATTPEHHRSLRSAIQSHLEQGGEVTPVKSGVDASLEMESTVAVIPLHGTIGKHVSPLERMFGAVDVDEAGAVIAEAAADESIDRIVLDINSPGGTITGVPELAKTIREATEIKEVIAFTDDLMASAAYWLGSQTDAIYSTMSAEVGSVGVYMALLDESEAMAMDGVKVNAIHSGAFKLAGASFKPLEDAEREMFQADVEKWHDRFKADVNIRRNVDAQFMEGQTFDGDDAARFGLTDGVVDSIEDLFALTSAR